MEDYEDTWDNPELSKKRSDARRAMFDYAIGLKDRAKYDPKHIREALIEIAIEVSINFH